MPLYSVDIQETDNTNGNEGEMQNHLCNANSAADAEQDALSIYPTSVVITVQKLEE